MVNEIISTDDLEELKEYFLRKGDAYEFPYNIIHNIIGSHQRLHAKLNNVNEQNELFQKKLSYLTRKDSQGKTWINIFDLAYNYRPEGLVKFRYLSNTKKVYLNPEDIVCALMSKLTHELTVNLKVNHPTNLDYVLEFFVNDIEWSATNHWTLPEIAEFLKMAFNVMMHRTWAQNTVWLNQICFDRVAEDVARNLLLIPFIRYAIPT